ncbi:MAG: glutaredoxin [Candidatus Moranbacteria bacterium]|nr:glutaredoxin [Candidatus Moranbacteria bacterium]MBP6034066.1 glutaredoxin [Candidatus Moranbacteria bacterium]MBP7695818.1 glutaredoxin [Candidatus Moranbacteria bacterium]
MHIFWKGSLLFALLLAGIGVTIPSAEAADRVLIEVFERQDCAHCQAERVFLDELMKSQQDVEVKRLDIADAASKALFTQFTDAQGLSKATPLTVIGTEAIQGFDTEETTGALIIQAVEAGQGEERLGIAVLLERNIKTGVREEGAICDAETGVCKKPAPEYPVRVPFIGTVNAYAFSLPVLASILGFIDGFNPCAMWVLVTFLLVLMQIESRERMLSVAGLFIVAEAVMYYLILNIWFTTWDFVGLDQIVTPIIGLLAIGGGGFFLYEWKTADGACKIIDAEKRVSIIASVKKLAHEPLTWVSAAGIVALAFSVNVIEFACSIGIPQAFTKILELNQLHFLQEQGLMALYIFFYMLDDFLVFGLALWGAQHLHLTQKYSRWSTFVGGILMLILGLILIFSPEALRFV